MTMGWLCCKNGKQILDLKSHNVDPKRSYPKEQSAKNKMALESIGSTTPMIESSGKL